MENKMPESGTMYDLSILEELDDPGYVVEVISLFLTSYPPDLADMFQLLQEEDWSGINRKAHRLKGAVGVLQATAVSSLLASIEHNARDLENLSTMPQRLAALKGLLDRLDTQLREELEQITKNR